jgi:pyruvate dehydrogenase E2 component (dihydrolipoamide acetyltransferase)
VNVAAKLGQLHALALGEEGEPVVLLHGFGGDALNWRYAIDELAAGHRTIAVDLPGHGASTKQVGTADVGELAGAVLELLDAEDVGRAHFVGHSLGGLLAAHLALEQPERVASLALLAPAGFGDQIDAEFIDAMVSASSRRELKVALRKLFADEALLTRQLAEEVLRYKRLEGVPEALGALRDNLFPAGHQTLQLADELAPLELPILVVWGTEDRIIPSAQASAAPASARVELLKEVGHSPHVEAAPRVNALLAEHLANAAGG